MQEQYDAEKINRSELFENIHKEKGWGLIPLDGKIPVLANWQQWCKTKRPFNPKDFKGRNAGIPCGLGNGIIAVDVDDVLKFNAYIKKNQLFLPKTRVHQTGNGGFHLICAYPQDGSEYGCRSFKNNGFDIRGMGGQVVCPGSIHPETKKVYTVRYPGPIAEAPQWLKDLARRKPEIEKVEPGPQQGDGAPEILQKLPYSVRRLIEQGEVRGQRSEAIMSALNALVRAGASDADIISIFESYPIGEKYREVGATKQRWLQSQIQKVRVGHDESAVFEKAILLEDDFLNINVMEKKILLAPWLTEQSISLVTGWRGTGKTWFALGILDAVTNGTSFGPWQAGEPAPALFLDGEMPVSDVKDRLKSLSTEKDRKAPLYIYCDAYANLLGLPRAHLLNSDWRSKLKKTLCAKAIKLLVLDNLASLSPGLDENAKKDWDPVNQWLLELRFAGISTLMLHHSNKDGGQRGTSAREDNIDVSLFLKSPADYVPEDGARFTIHFSKARVRTADLAEISDCEMKLTEIDGKARWTWATMKRKTKDMVLTMLDKGNDQKKIADALQVAKSHISQIRQRAINEGLLDSQNKLTQKGREAVL